jgi:hypothetical protein
MCIFHEVLSYDQAFEISPIVVALSSLQSGSTLFAEIAAVVAQEPTFQVGRGAKQLVAVAKDPDRYLRVLTGFEPDQGNGQLAVTSLSKELALESLSQQYVPAAEPSAFPAAEPSAAARHVMGATSIEEALERVAIAGNAARPEFLDWFRENPSLDGAPRAIKILERVAGQIDRPLPALPGLESPFGAQAAANLDRDRTSSRPCCQQP